MTSPEPTAAPKTAPLSSAARNSLVFGVLSLVCTVFAGVPAVVLGVLGLRQIRRSGGALRGRGLALAGIALGAVGCLGVAPYYLAWQWWKGQIEIAESANNLVRFAVAMSGFNDSHPGPPGHAWDGKLSWRVHILPYIEQNDLYKQFHLDEPWDGEHNRALLSKIPHVYAPVRDGAAPAGYTFYRMFAGSRSAFAGQPGPDVEYRGTDQAQVSFYFVEAGEAVPWTKPEELPNDPDRPLPPLGGLFDGGFNAYCTDNQVHFFPRGTDEKTLRAHVPGGGAAGGEPYLRNRPLGDWVTDLKDPQTANIPERVLTQGGAAAAPSLVAALSDPDEGVRFRAGRILRDIGPAAVPALREALAGKDKTRRIEAMVQLGSMQSTAKPAVPDLTAALADPEGDVRTTAMYALGAIGPEARSAAPALANLLRDPNPAVRMAAAGALWQVDRQAAPAAVAALTEVVKDKNGSAREVAAKALGRIGADARDAVPALRDALRDKDDDFRSIVAQTLGEIGPDSKETVLALLRVVKEDASDDVRTKATLALERVSPETAGVAADLEDALKDARAPVRAAAAGALGRLVPARREAVPRLLMLLKDPDFTVRKAAADALQHIDPDAAKQAGVP